MKKEKKKLVFSLSPDLQQQVWQSKEKQFPQHSQAEVFRSLIRLGLGESSQKEEGGGGKELT